MSYKVKTCRICKLVLPISAFHKHTTNKDGLRNECKICTCVAQNKRYDYDYTRARCLLRDYGITINNYNEMFKEQQGCCAICRRHQSEFEEALCVDHNHETKKVRGLLCRACNSQLGAYENGKDAFEKYLLETE